MMSSAARFVDKVAIVTGAATGIGRATLARLASEGATLLFAERQGKLDLLVNRRRPARGAQRGGDAGGFRPYPPDQSGRYRPVLPRGAAYLGQSKGNIVNTASTSASGDGAYMNAEVVRVDGVSWLTTDRSEAGFHK